MNHRLRLFVLSTILCSFIFNGIAQVANVEFGRNRVQYKKKFKWEYFQSDNFHVYHYQHGYNIAKYAIQVAEEELPKVEDATGERLQRRAVIVLYNDFNESKQSNIGLFEESSVDDGTTRLANSKMIVYFNGNYEHLRTQIRQGIAKILVSTKLFGANVGQAITNTATLDLPEWLTKGYIEYATERWSTEKDDKLKDYFLSGRYSKFSSIAYHNPELAGHAFWYYIEEKYGKDEVNRLLNAAIQNKSINKATRRLFNIKLKNLLKEFFEFNGEKYDEDVDKRKQYPKGSEIESFNVNNRKDYFNITVNPLKKNNTFLVTEYNKGIVRLLYYDDDRYNTVLKYGVNTYKSQIDRQYPISCWDAKGEKFSVLWWEKGELLFFTYDAVNKSREQRRNFTDTFDQVQDMKYMPYGNQIIFSAVKNGQSDIFVFDFNTEKLKQITNDVYNDLDASYVALPSKKGFLFSSNRPVAEANNSDTAMVRKGLFNIFFADEYGDARFNQITQLTDMKYGDARYPADYNESHFTFISDENGIKNRYAGFFTTSAAGIDTLVLIGNDILRNPTIQEVDSALFENKKDDIDSLVFKSISNDKAYVFPLTNYESSIAETKVAGEKGVVSEVTLQNNEKILYKLKVDEDKLRKRNQSIRNTTFRQKLIDEEKKNNLDAEKLEASAAANTDEDEFQTEFKDSTSAAKIGDIFKSYKIDGPSLKDKLARVKHFSYKPSKFTIDNLDLRASPTNSEFTTAMVNARYEPYFGLNTNDVAAMQPIRINQQGNLNGLTRFGIYDVLEDHVINGAYRLGNNFRDNQIMINYMNFKRRLDWGGTYYRTTEELAFQDPSLPTDITLRLFTNIYTVKLRMPINESFSVRLHTGIRNDRYVFQPASSAFVTAPGTLLSALAEPDQKFNYVQNRLELVWDNSLFMQKNIHFGFRGKVFVDYNFETGKQTNYAGPTNVNLGADLRYYKSIWRNFIWAFRAAGDLSIGDQRTVYFLGGPDNRLMFGASNIRTIPFTNNGNYIVRNIYANPVANDPSYAFQGLAIGMRGFRQNLASGNANIIFNSEFRLPIFGTVFEKQVNNPFLRNLMFIQFFDFGNAWNTSKTYDKFDRPRIFYPGISASQLPATIKAGGIGPLAGSYGFGARSYLFNYYVRFDAGWQMTGLFRGKPMLSLSTGFDF